MATPRPKAPGTFPTAGEIRDGQRDPFGGLEGDDRNAAVAIQNLFESYGLGSLAPKIVEFIQQGYDANTVAILLQNTAEYKQRFKGNEQRRSAGLPVLTPAEYLATERAYRELMSSAGLPPGFYDEPDDFTSWIANDVSPAEVQTRVDAAVKLVHGLDADQRAYFENFYTTGDMIAYALDRDRATPILEKQIAAAQIGGAAAAQGVGVDRGLAEQIAQTGVNSQQARQGFGIVAAERDNLDKLGGIYGEDAGEDDLVKEVFFDDAEAGEKRRRLASRERATFGGSAGTGRTSLSQNSGGQL